MTPGMTIFQPVVKASKHLRRYTRGNCLFTPNRAWGLLLLTLLTCVQFTIAQQILFRNYTVKDGLGSNTVWDIAQDKQGFMWFATKNGLNRFNGHEFITYRYSREMQYAIGNNFIHAICHFDNNKIWLGTEAGAYILDLETEKFVKAGV
ncbi:MAG: hypothetical protein EOO04_31245, partial [Chitinophagaceae bacterium]